MSEKKLALETLYRKNNKGQVCEWSFIKVGDYYRTEFRILGGTVRTNDIVCAHKDENTFIKRTIEDKLKAGYKRLSDVKDNRELPVNDTDIQRYLETYLPDERTNSSGNKLHMLATTFQFGDLDKREYFFQPKINGLRCGIFPYRTDDIFSPIRLKFQSREGGEFINLSYLEANLLETIPFEVFDELVDRGSGIDGELYIHGKSLNAINSAVKNATNPDNKLVEFWAYDLIDEDMLQHQRFHLMEKWFLQNHREISDNVSKLKYLGYGKCLSISSAVIKRNEFIDQGFEGLILRDVDGLYQFGKRNKTMLKFKQTTDGVFEIVDIKPLSIKRPDLPMLVCRNDINDELFECRISASESYQQIVLKNKNAYIGNKVNIEYGERSGVKQVPFHIKSCNICSC